MSTLSSVFAVTRLFARTLFAMTLAASFSLWSVVSPAADEVPELGDTSSAPRTAASSVSSRWPVQVIDNGRTFLIYQPQIDKWETNRLEGRSAVSVRNDAGAQQNFGVITFSARTDLDPGSRTVTVRDLVISNADFPTVTTGVDDYLSVLRPQFAAQIWRIAQDRLQSDIEIDRLAQQASRQPLKNDPPRILYSERPALLVPIDGNPVLRPVADTGLMRVTNTRALMVRDKATSRYFLFVSDHWMESQSLESPWLVTTNPSAQLERARQLATLQDQVDLLDADAGEGAATPASVAVFISTMPTELLQTDGPAQYSPIEHTQLLYVTNSPNTLFLDLRTQYHYALISGRWYRTTTLAQGQWSYVPATSLPGDFAMIPAEHPTESVRAAVPGTPQAREAVIANSVPQVATVARSAAHLEITYDGNPVFQPIEGTVLQNAVNSPVPVLRVSETSFYALDNGVWFVATSPFGPWTVTSYVASVIYSIPRNSPLYYVTYVRVYDATPEVVYVGYTPGYVGSYVSSDNVVVYGTGWPYSPWIGSVWYGAPVTWGFGFSFMHSWWNPYPWYSWNTVAWAPPSPCFRPWWGPWHAPVYGYRRPGFVAGGVNAIRPPGPGLHNVGRIYDRWDRRSVVWNGPRAIANQQRPAAPTLSHRAPDSGFVTGSDDRWRRLGDDGNRNRGRRDGQVRDNVANLAAVQTSRAVQRPPAVQTPSAVQTPAAVQTPRAVQTPPAVQTPWRRPPVVNQEDRRFAPLRTQPPSFEGHERRPPVAGVSIERMPSQPQRAMPPSRSFSPQAGLIERPVVAHPGRGMERLSVNSGRIVERSADGPQFRGDGGRGFSNSSGGGGGFRGGDRNR